MAIDFSDEKRFIGIWFVWPPGEDSGFPHRRADWFAASWLTPEGLLEFTYRFHYYDNPDDPSEGDRNWEGMRSRKPVEEAEIADHLNFMHQMGGMNVLRNGTSMDFIDCKMCNGSQAVELLSAYPWWHKAKGRVNDPS